MTIVSDGIKTEELSIRKPSAFRRILPQVIAVTVKNIHLIDGGLTVGITSILIPALSGIPNEQNKDEYLSMTGVQSSWLVSSFYATQMLGNLFSGVVTDIIGRKRAMLFVNIPFAVGWFLLYQATEISFIFLGLSMLGLAIGLMEASIMTYVGEVSQTSIRGILVAYSGMCHTVGTLIIYFLNVWMPWRSVALFCLSVPMISVCCLCFVPETPQWLLSKKRSNHAEKSLRWLRGWTTKEVVAHEFYELQRYSERSNACYLCIKQDLQCIHPPPTLAEKISEMKRKPTLKPFTIILAAFFLIQFTGAAAMRPFIAQIFKAYENPIPIDNTMMILGVSDNLTRLLFMCLIRFTGKRRFYMTMLFGIFVSSFMISCYGFIYLPKGFVSFDLKNQTSHLENPNFAYVAVVLLFIWNFCSFGGFSSMPWMFLSEMLPFKSRVITSGIVAAIFCMMGFLSAKTYYNFEMTLSMPGTSLLYSAISGVGLILMYFILPETEGRSLEEIELHFSDNSKNLTDRKIAKNPQKTYGLLYG